MTTAMSFSESIDFLQEVEAKHDLLSHRVDGWSAWCVVRMAIQLRLVRRGLSAVGRVSYRHRLVAAAKDMAVALGSGRTSHVVKTFSSALVEREGSHYKDVWFDDLLQRIGPGFKIELLNNPMFLDRRSRALKPSDMTTSAFDLLASTAARVGGRTEAALVATAISRALSQELGPGAVPEEWVRRQLRWFLAQKRLYRWLLSRLRPRFLLVADPSEHGSVAAAKELGVRAVELQHGGTTDRFHGGYAWTDYATPFRGTMPIPDRLFLFGEHTRQDLEGSGFWGDALRVVGCPRIDQYRRLRRTPLGSGCTILLTTGPSVAETISFMAEFLRKTRSVAGLRLVVKLHPIYERGPEPYFAAFGHDERVRVLTGSEDPSTFELLTGASVHVSVSSSCHYDALGVGVPTVILPLPTHEVVLPLYQAGHALLARTPDELAAITARWESHRVQESVSAHYFRPDSVDNMAAELTLSAGAMQVPLDTTA